MGQIKWIDAIKRTGVIFDGDKGDALHFTFSDVETGTPREGQTVQFTRQDAEGKPPVAKKIVVLDDLAKGKFKY